MKELYNEVRQIIDFELDAAEEKYSFAYCRNLWRASGILTSLVVIGGIFGIYCIYADIHWGFYIFFAFALGSVICFKAYRKKYMKHVAQLFNDDCCVIKALTAYVVMLKHSRRGENGEALLAWIGTTLFYLGKFDECKEIVGLIEENFDTNIGKAYRCSLLAIVALYERNEETIELCKKELETAVSQMPERYAREAYSVISKYPEIMEAEENGNYDKMVLLLKTNNGQNTTLKKVSENYRLYKVAKAAGMEMEAAEHRAYVLEKGGDTFYKKELENVG